MSNIRDNQSVRKVFLGRDSDTGSTAGENVWIIGVMVVNAHVRWPALGTRYQQFGRGCSSVHITPSESVSEETWTEPGTLRDEAVCWVVPLDGSSARLTQRDIKYYRRSPYRNQSHRRNLLPSSWNVRNRYCLSKL